VGEAVEEGWGQGLVHFPRIAGYGPGWECWKLVGIVDSGRRSEAVLLDAWPIDDDDDNNLDSQGPRGLMFI
jgi:hypothetical protein